MWVPATTKLRAIIFTMRNIGGEGGAGLPEE
jgi:hypothetical protein